MVLHLKLCHSTLLYTMEHGEKKLKKSNESTKGIEDRRRHNFIQFLFGMNDVGSWSLVLKVCKIVVSSSQISDK